MSTQKSSIKLKNTLLIPYSIMKKAEINKQLEKALRLLEKEQYAECIYNVKKIIRQIQHHQEDRWLTELAILEKDFIVHSNSEPEQRLYVFIKSIKSELGLIDLSGNGSPTYKDLNTSVPSLKILLAIITLFTLLVTYFYTNLRQAISLTTKPEVVYLKTLDNTINDLLVYKPNTNAYITAKAKFNEAQKDTLLAYLRNNELKLSLNQYAFSLKKYERNPTPNQSDENHRLGYRISQIIRTQLKKLQ